MPQLTKQMYRSVNEIGPFGLIGSQMRSGAYIHNPGWYNGNGEFLGWGDLKVDDLQKIAAEIAEDEAFVVIDETDWRTQRHPELKSEKGYEHVPVDFLARHALCVIRRGRIAWRDQSFYTRVVEKLDAAILVGVDAKAIVACIVGSV